MLPMIAPAPAAENPKLIVAIAVDQFRYDYLTRYRGQYTGGLNRLLTKGAVFTNANYEHAPTVTAVGHSTFLSGALPCVSGIVANEWFDRVSGKNVTSVIVVTDSAWLYATGYTHYIDNIRYGNAFITSPDGAGCHEADGDAQFQGDHGKGNGGGYCGTGGSTSGGGTSSGGSGSGGTVYK